MLGYDYMMRSDEPRALRQPSGASAVAVGKPSSSTTTLRSLFRAKSHRTPPPAKTILFAESSAIIDLDQLLGSVESVRACVRGGSLAVYGDADDYSFGVTDPSLAQLPECPLERQAVFLDSRETLETSHQPPPAHQPQLVSVYVIEDKDETDFRRRIGALPSMPPSPPFTRSSSTSPSRQRTGSRPPIEPLSQGDHHDYTKDGCTVM